MLTSKLILKNILKPLSWRSATQSAAVLTTFRFSSFRSSPEVRPIEKYPEVEVLQNPPEWKYVERILPPVIIPKPVQRAEYPSGWQLPTNKDTTKLKYFVARTKNYMVPVYLKRTYRGQRRVTILRRIYGDIWTLEQELRAVVENARNGRACATRVNEMSGQISIHGDYVDVVREYVKQQGF